MSFYFSICRMKKGTSHVYYRRGNFLWMGYDARHLEIFEGLNCCKRRGWWRHLTRQPLHACVILRPSFKMEAISGSWQILFLWRITNQRWWWWEEVTWREDGISWFWTLTSISVSLLLSNQPCHNSLIFFDSHVVFSFFFVTHFWKRNGFSRIDMKRNSHHENFSVFWLFLIK